MEVIEEKKPNCYKIFLELVKGYMIYLSIGSFPERNKRLENIIIYLDTNILFDIMGLNYPEFTEPAEELFKMCKRNKLSLVVCDFTIFEAKNYLDYCLIKRKTKIVKDKMKVGSRCYYLKEYTLTSDMIDIIQNFENKVQKLGIKIEKTGIDLTNYKPKDNSITKTLDVYKSGQYSLSRNHDIAAIEFIKSLRALKNYQRIEDSKAIFLTNDRYLSRSNYELDHKDGTIPEVILDRSLTNIIWLNNPSIDIKIDKVIASCCRGLFINPKIWEHFLEIFNSLIDKKELEDKDLETLLYNNYLGEMLAGYTKKDKNRITPEFIKENIIIVKTHIREDIKDKVTEIFNDIIYIVRLIITGILALHLMFIVLLFMFKPLDIRIGIFVSIILILLMAIMLGIGPSSKIWSSFTEKVIRKYSLKE